MVRTSENKEECSAASYPPFKPELGEGENLIVSKRRRKRGRRTARRQERKRLDRSPVLACVVVLLRL